MLDIGSREIAVIAAVLVVFFGPKKIPELAKNIIQAMKELKQVFRDDAESAKNQKK